MADRPPVAPRWRLFLAAPVPEQAAAALWESLAPLRHRHPAARWARLDQLHATLVFLGQTDPADVQRLVDAIDRAGPRHASFVVSTGEAGGRLDDRRGGVAWLTVNTGRRQLAELALDLDRVIGSGAYRGAAPRPHVTVARRIDQALLDDLRTTALHVRVDWPVDRIVLMRSHSDPGGSRYESLAERLLTGDRSTP
jgi:RNA 2',3'-cyclic 3'-phosphodiesterase